jgi:hypothetical protein
MAVWGWPIAAVIEGNNVARQGFIGCRKLERLPGGGGRRGGCSASGLLWVDTGGEGRAWNKHAGVERHPGGQGMASAQWLGRVWGDMGRWCWKSASCPGISSRAASLDSGLAPSGLHLKECWRVQGCPRARETDVVPEDLVYAAGRPLFTLHAPLLEMLANSMLGPSLLLCRLVGAHH